MELIEVPEHLQKQAAERILGDDLNDPLGGIRDGKLVVHDDKRWRDFLASQESPTERVAAVQSELCREPVHSLAMEGSEQVGHRPTIEPVQGEDAHGRHRTGARMNEIPTRTPHYADEQPSVRWYEWAGVILLAVGSVTLFLCTYPIRWLFPRR